MTYSVRFAQVGDIPSLVDLCAEHAAFEHATFDSEGKSARLIEALLGDCPRLRAWVVTQNDHLAGYATASEEFSTWKAAVYLHMDCLFVRPSHRNKGLGAAMLEKVKCHAISRGLSEVQWQTPAWNTDAHRFYLRHGAVAHDKVRFVLQFT